MGIILNQHHWTCVLQQSPNNMKIFKSMDMMVSCGKFYEIHCNWNWNWNNTTVNIIALKWKLNVICTEKLQWHWNTTAFSQCTHSSISGYISESSCCGCSYQILKRYVLYRISFAIRASVKKHTFSAQRTFAVFLRAGYSSYAIIYPGGQHLFRWLFYMDAMCVSGKKLNSQM